MTRTKLDLEGKAHRLAEILRTQKEARDWDKYLACEPHPDAQVEGDMNSFLNSWLLDDSVDLADVTAACDNAFRSSQTWWRSQRTPPRPTTPR
ncbi:hypothetical protein PINS_up023414 [Pythium insidiosum]|nr:hypothetical protein PINS_up023414 [Pythium insidiosum]